MRITPTNPLLPPGSSPNDKNAAAIQAVQQMQNTQTQLQDLLNDPSPDSDQINNVYNELNSQWNQFLSLPVEDPEGVIAYTKTYGTTEIETLGLTIVDQDYPNSIKQSATNQSYFQNMIDYLKS